MLVLLSICFFDPEQIHAVDNKSYTCCQKEIKRFNATELKIKGIQDISLKKPVGEDEFSRKRSAERIESEKKKYFDGSIRYDIIRDDIYKGILRISEYDFEQQGFLIEFGYTEADGINDSIGRSYYPSLLLIADENGNPIEMPLLKMSEKDAEQFVKNKNKTSPKLFIVYTPIKTEVFKYTYLFLNVPGSGETVRVYIKLFYAALIAGKNKFVVLDSPVNLME